MFPCFTQQRQQQKRKISSEQWCGEKGGKENKFTTVIFRHGHGQTRIVLPFKFGSVANGFIPPVSLECLNVCVSHVFPSHRMMCLLTSFYSSLQYVLFFVDSFCEYSKSHLALAALIFVWSIQSSFSFFRSDAFPRRKTFFLQDVALQQKHTQEQEVCKLFRQKKEERNAVMWCFFFLLLIMEQNVEIPFAKAISQYNDNVPSFLSSQALFCCHHVKTFRVFSIFSIAFMSLL